MLQHRLTGEPLVQPERGDGDPSVTVVAIDRGFYEIAVGDKIITVSGFNAWRIFGMLGFLLGFELPAKIWKAIRLG